MCPVRLCTRFDCANAFSMPVWSGKCIFQECLLNKNTEMAEFIFAFAKQHRFELPFDWTSPDGTRSNLLTESLQSQSSQLVREAVRLIGSELTPFIPSAALMKHSFKDVLQQHPETMEQALSEDHFIVNLGQLMVHADYVNPRLIRDSAVNIESSDTMVEWTLDSNPSRLEHVWNRKYSETVASMKKDGNRSATKASLKTVSIEDAAKVGMNGILRRLLFREMPADIFKSTAVKWIIMYKWFKIWRNRFRWKAASYAIFLLFFAIYAIFISHTSELSKQSALRRTLSTVLMAVCFAFGVDMLLEECRQLRTLMNDGLQYFDSWKWGMRYYWRSKWNQADMFSCLMLLVLIPVFHMLSITHSGFDDWLSGIVAMECVLASIKVSFPMKLTSVDPCCRCGTLRSHFVGLVLWC